MDRSFTKVEFQFARQQARFGNPAFAAYRLQPMGAPLGVFHPGYTARDSLKTKRWLAK